MTRAGKNWEESMKIRGWSEVTRALAAGPASGVPRRGDNTGDLVQLL